MLHSILIYQHLLLQFSFLGRGVRHRSRRGRRPVPQRPGLPRLRPRSARGTRPPRRVLLRRPDRREGQRRRRGDADPGRLRRLGTSAREGGRRLRPDVSRHGSHPARQEPALGVRLLGRRRAPAPGRRPVPLVDRPRGGGVLGRVRSPGRGRCAPARARQRRRRVDPDSYYQ